MKKLLRILFSRVTVSVLFIIAEVLAMALVLNYAASYYAAFNVIARVIGVLVFLSLINRDTNPEFKLTWLAVVLILPLFGALLYVIFSKRYTTRSETKFLLSLGEKLNKNRKESRDLAVSNEMLSLLSSRDFGLGGIALSLTSSDPLSCLYPDTGAKYYSSGEELYSDLLLALESAEKYIFLEYFIIEEGVMWEGIYAVLKKRASEGVTVRVLYDDFGSMSTLPKGFDKSLLRDGIEARCFSPIRPTLTSSHNNRDHRKIAVIDGEVAFTGGVNIADEYINERRRFGYWKDGGIRIEGIAARGFARLFLSLFNLTVRSDDDYGEFLPPIEASEAGAPEGKDVMRRGFLLPLGSGPMPFYRSPVGKSALMNIICAAKHYVYITTPYLIIDYDLTEALLAAAKRGVDVRIITPGIADKRLIKIITKSAYPALCEGGVRIFEYTKGFIHEKTVVSDDVIAMTGTVNLDYRSLAHHFEDMLALFLSDEIINIRLGVQKTLSDCCEITKDEAKLGVTERVVRALTRIIFPLL